MTVLAAADDAMFSLFRVLRDDDTADATEHNLSADSLRRMYRELRRLRLLDEKMLIVQRQGRIGFYGEVKGQEATPIAAGLALDPEDWVFPGLREGAVMLVRGFSLAKYMAQCWGNSLDVQKGRQMPSHYSGRQVNQVSWSSCIGPQIPQAVGCAWAMKLRGTKNISVGFFGDGATSEPDFHAAATFAGVHRLPVVLVCQNNHWAISVPSSTQTAAPTFASKAIAYGLHGVRVDGNDPLAVYVVLRDAAARARAGGGATLVESVTYRIGAHSSSDDPSRYRSQSDVDRWIAKDPVERMRRHLVSLGLHDDAAERELVESIDAEIRAAVLEAESAAPVDRATLFDDVYAVAPWHIEEQRREHLSNAPAPSGHGR